MALITVNCFSSMLMRTVPINVILPVDKQVEAVRAEEDGARYVPNEPAGGFKTLYLLHGIFGNYTDWVSGTCIQRWAEERDLAVVMPSGDNMFYLDQPAAHDYYGRFIGEELVALTRAMFPLSRRREDTFIGGLSMGGYGALRNGLKYADTFGAIASMSGALLVDGVSERTDDTSTFFQSRRFAKAVYGDPDAVAGSDRDPLWLAGRLAASGGPLPRIYVSCGTEDSLLAANRDVARELGAQGFSVTYEEAAGGHTWEYWNRAIERVVDWLPLDEPVMGIGSGNVHV